ncbi:MAG: YqaJ viral recombinase family protein [Patescibacteria group bacterium]|nr:YqaJ viral recombinase family protein [Patescibacteria group bacterium]
MSIIDDVNARRNWSVILANRGGLTEEQAKARMIGGSDIAAICGISPLRGAMDVYLDFFGLHMEPRADTPVLRRGRLHEDAIAQDYAQREGVELTTVAQPLVHPRFPWWTASPDRLVWRLVGCSSVVEIKDVAWYAKHHWSQGAPPWYRVQVLWYMEALTAPLGRIVADIDKELCVYDVEPDREIIEALTEAAVNFWEQHIVPGVPPDLDASDATQEFLRSKFPAAGKEWLTADADLNETARILADARREKERMKDIEDRLKAQLQSIIGTAYGVKGDGWQATWHSVQGRESTDWKAVVADLAKQAGLAPSSVEQIIKAHIKRGEPTRAFRFTSKE